jgi:hypothetical protein
VVIQSLGGSFLVLFHTLSSVALSSARRLRYDCTLYYWKLYIVYCILVLLQTISSMTFESDSLSFDQADYYSLTVTQFLTVLRTLTIVLLQA